MSNVQQMEENIRIMKGFEGLSDSQRKVIDDARKMIETYPVIPCTSCEYCSKVCPKNIGISGTFYAENLLVLYGNLQAAVGQEGWQSASSAASARTRARSTSPSGRCWTSPYPTSSSLENPFTKPFSFT